MDYHSFFWGLWQSIHFTNNNSMKKLILVSNVTLVVNLIAWGILSFFNRPSEPNAYGKYNDMGDWWLTLHEDKVVDVFKPLNQVLTLLDQDEQFPWLITMICLFALFFYYLSKKETAKGIMNSIFVGLIALVSLWWIAFFIYMCTVTPGFRLIVDCPH